MRVFNYFFIVVLSLAGMVNTIYLVDAVLKTKSSQIIKIDPNNLLLIEKVSVHIKKYYAENSQLPDWNEINKWMDKNNRSYEGIGYSYEKPPFHNHLDRVFGVPPKDAFILNYWDGDFFVIYASWFGEGKQAYIPDSQFFHFGSQLADCFILSIILVVIIKTIVTILKK